MGGSLFDAAAKALEFFCAPDWEVRSPHATTLMEVDDPGRSAAAEEIPHWARKHLGYFTNEHGANRINPANDWLISPVIARHVRLRHAV
jgi:hypothetical protein